MTSHDRRSRALAICLATLAGYVDALGFMESRGFFVSFMSGNSTRLGVGLAGLTGSAAAAGGLIAAFVAGVMVGSLSGRAVRRRRQAAVLLVVAGLLAAAAGLGAAGMTVVAIGAAAMAMGAENAVFERDGEVSLGVTYMTGALVKLGQRLAGALTGGDRWGWSPYLLLWLGLVGGAVTGALLYPQVGLSGLWIAAGAAALLAALAARFMPEDR